jgi:hypothetical protein
MLGLALGHTGASLAYLTWDVVAALVAAVVFAGPMVGNLSRWRVSVDAATASLLMMLAATAVLLWHGSRRILRIVWGGDSRRAG